MALEDLLDTDHQARLVWDFCTGLDLQPLYESIRSREGGPGRAAIDPRLCVALWLYATLEGVGSARALAWLCSHHHAFRWLCGGVSVNHHTLSDFRVDHVDFLDRLLTHSVAVLREQDLVDLNRVAHDGMRVRASAGAASFHRRRHPGGMPRRGRRPGGPAQGGVGRRPGRPVPTPRRGPRARRPRAGRAAPAGPGAAAGAGGQEEGRREGQGPGLQHRPGGDGHEDGRRRLPPGLQHRVRRRRRTAW